MPSPADFPLGSPQSRAAARALVVARKTPHHLSQADEDALTIYCGMVYVDVRMTPSYEEIERLDVYARGEELHDARYGPILPKVETDRDWHRTRASSEFEHAFGREPETVDILRSSSSSPRIGSPP